MLNRRDFLRTTAALGAAGVLSPFALEAEAVRLPGGSILDLPASAAPIDTVVAIMMENRSFDFVDHRLYDHSSILRFLEWRFLGAPREGKGRRDDSWFLTTRDRHAKNIGWSLQPDRPDPEFDADVGADPGTSPGCAGAEGLALGARFAPPAHDLARGLATGYFERMGYPIGDWLPSHVR